MESKVVCVVGALAFLPVLIGPTGAQDEAIEEAKTTARAWLVLQDRHDFDQSWESAAELLRAAVTQKEWTAKWSVTLSPLGNVQSRGLRSAEYATTLPGAPEGEYVIVKFDTAFENNKAVEESLILGKEPDGLWRVASYYVR